MWIKELNNVRNPFALYVFSLPGSRRGHRIIFPSQNIAHGWQREPAQATACRPAGKNSWRHLSIGVLPPEHTLVLQFSASDQLSLLCLFLHDAGSEPSARATHMWLGIELSYLWPNELKVLILPLIQKQVTSLADSCP